jgi:2-oxoglutarate dehydrogenase E2 component (dihydrolipoamide succinyltransferase)
MSLDIKVPSVGESITEVTIANWHKKDGDSVNVDDVLCELESDKATFELNAESAGILRIVAREGETIPIGGLICRIEEGNGAQGSNGTAQAPKTAAKTEPYHSGRQPGKARRSADAATPGPARCANAAPDPAARAGQGPGNEGAGRGRIHCRSDHRPLAEKGRRPGAAGRGTVRN